MSLAIAVPVDLMAWVPDDSPEADHDPMHPSILFSELKGVVQSWHTCTILYKMITDEVTPLR